MSKNYRQRRRKRLAEDQDNLCFFCDEPLLFYPDDTSDGNHPLVASDDHFIARAAGGRGTMANLVIAHRQCNSERNHSAKEHHYVDKLARLNEKRGFSPVDDEPFGSIHTYTIASPAALALFDRLNCLSEEDIPQARRFLTKLFSVFHYAVSQFRGMSDHQFRYKLFHKWLKEFLIERRAGIDALQHMIDDDDFVVYQYLENILSTHAKKKLLKDRSHDDLRGK